MNESAGRVEGSDGNAIPDPAEVLEVSEACDAAAVIVAEVICRRCDLPFSQVIQVASRELFDAARMVADLAMREVGQTIQPEGG